MFLFGERRRDPAREEGKGWEGAPVDGGVVLQLGEERLDVSLVVKVISMLVNTTLATEAQDSRVDRSMPYEVRSFCDGAAIWGTWIPRRIVGLEVWCNSCKMLQRIETVSVVELR